MDEIRTIQILPAPWDLPFPHARQALLIERHTRDPHGNRLSDGAVLGITTNAQPRHRHRANPRLEEDRLTADGRRLDRHGAGRIVRRVARRAGISKPVGPHTLRHAFITAALDAGVPPARRARGRLTFRSADHDEV